MTATIDRRQFLVGMIGLGAAIALPTDATSLQVDQLWNKLLADPWNFEVGEFGTIVEPGDQEPKIRSDVYDISVEMIKTPASLVSEVVQYDELRSHFEAMAVDELDGVQHDLSVNKQLSQSQRQRLKKLEEALLDLDNGWQNWVHFEGKDGLSRFKDVIDTWLADDVDWSQMEFWPREWSSQGRALRFFEQMDCEILEELGVVIVEGDHPGSSYYAAELRNSIADANVSALNRRLPFRFKEEVLS